MNKVMGPGPDPNQIYPMQPYDKLVFLKNFIKASNIHIYDFSKVKLVIGKFCAIAAETKFIMTGDHKLDAISTYPFPIFQQGWKQFMISLSHLQLGCESLGRS